ncbi:PAAR domain-containing protein [Streptomyces sp. NPDC004111]|uniref:PAAR domain-containing protein n=1 Tax=Streptomyces sp. NPDC004111 TaxID=3364690 RepID=UPI003674A6E3
MPAAARIGDPTTHGGVLAPPPGAAGVWIEGMPAAVLGDLHLCPVTPSHPPSTPLVSGSSSVLFGGRPAARALVDPAGCGAAVATGAARTLVGG